MTVRKGGSYAVDPNTGDARHVAGTEPATFTREAQGAASAPAAEVSTAPSPTPIPAKDASGARRPARPAAAPKE